MQKKLHYLVFTTLTFFLFSALATAQQKDWTMLVYIIGSDLESGSDAGTIDIEEMMNAESTDNVHVIVLTGGANKEGWETPTAYSIENGEQFEIDFVPSNPVMSEISTLTEFINYGTENFPADKTMLTLWNHGSDIRGYGNDEVSGKNFSVPKITEAIANSNFIMNANKFEIIGFDACLMSNIETQSSLKNFAHWYIGSEEQEPGHGWNYTPIINTMEGGTTPNGDQVGKVIVDGFIAQANEQETTALTLAVTDLSKVAALENSLSTLFAKLVTDGKVQKLHRARAKAEEYSKSIKDPQYSEDMVDIGDMMKKLKQIDPSLSPEADSVLARLNEAVSYEKNDMARPKATGISMYIPHNVLVDEGELYYVIDTHYVAINFNSSLKEFIVDTYVPQALADDNPPSGNVDPDFVFFGPNPNPNFLTGDSISAIVIPNVDDLEQVQVVLVEEFDGYPDEFIMLGSTHADTIVEMGDGSAIYAYKWDELWLGINGYPAYISDLHDFEVEDDEGNLTFYTRIHIPALLNPNTPNEEEIIIAYRYDEDFNYVLENIMPEIENNDGNVLVPKERIFLGPGDVVQLLYEGFNEVTDEQFFAVDNDAIFTIVNSNDDLELGYDFLPVGNYHIGYILEDHSQNDTIIFDTKTFMVMETGTGFIENTDEFTLFPNPASSSFYLQFKEFSGKEYQLDLHNVSGQLVHTQKCNTASTEVKFTLPNGFYTVTIEVDGQRIVDKLMIQN